MSYIVNKDIPQGCMTCLHGRFTDSGMLYCELKMHTPTEGEKIKRPDWCPLEECKSGKWELIKTDGKTYDDGWRCTSCGETYHTRVPYFGEYKYCPNCGAKME